MSIEAGLLIALVVLLGNAFFVGAEFALVSVRRSGIEPRALKGSRLAKITLVAMENVSLMLAGAQLGITVCSLIFGAVGEPIAAHVLEQPFHDLGVPDEFLHPVSFIVALTLMVYLHVVIGEMVPKNISLAKSMYAALILVPILYYTVKIFSPLIKLLNKSANLIIRLLGVKPRAEVRSSFNRDEVAGFVKESHREGLLSGKEEKLLSGALDLEERNIDHIVLSLNKVMLTSDKPTPLEIEKLCAITGFSRFPVPDEDGTLRGYVHLKDLLYVPDSQSAVVLADKFIRPLTQVKYHTSLRDTLALMRQTGAHIAEVKNNHKQTVGIVMLEDVLEELVGPIHDETRKVSV